jgi:hypothetical protein
MTTTSNDQSPVRRRTRRTTLPAISEIELLISQARTLRLKLVELATYEPLAESAKEGVQALSKAGQELERIIELVANAKRAGRRHRGPINKS